MAANKLKETVGDTVKYFDDIVKMLDDLPFKLLKIVRLMKL